MLAKLHLGLEGVTEVDTDAKGRFVYFKVTLSNNRVLYACAPSGHSTREQLIKGGFFEGQWKINEGKENKILLADFNITIDKMGMDGGNKALKLYRYRSKGPGFTLI